MGKKLISFLGCAFLFTAVSLTSISAKAVVAELGLFYFTDDLSSTSSISHSRTIYDFAVLMTSEGKRLLGIGWNYVGATSDDVTTATTSYSSTETGPKFTYMFGSNQDWYLGLAYNLLAKAQFSDANGSAEWRGTSLKAEFGFLPKITSRINAGVKLNYHQASYNEQITNTTTLTQTTNTKTMIYPTFSLVFKF
ncbi:hypothetical protein CIK05_00825 [Bdellovibrio sp. qaytius]|nr:hypothetical protein CIK05_00825 [Bdellovibrio sp. qaytius]